MKSRYLIGMRQLSQTQEIAAQAAERLGSTRKSSSLRYANDHELWSAKYSGIVIDEKVVSAGRVPAFSQMTQMIVDAIADRVETTQSVF